MKGLALEGSVIEIIKTEYKELGITIDEVKCEKGILDFVLEQLEAERLGLDQGEPC